MNAKSFNAKPSLALAWLICSLGIIFYSYEFLLRIMPSVMEPQIRSYFVISAEGFGALVGLYYMAYTPLQLAVGVIMDMFGPKRILTLAVIVCTIGNFIFGMAHTVWLAGVGRFMIGFGSAFAFVGALKLASVWLPANRFATFAGVVGGVSMVGAMVGDVGMTALVQHLGWQHTVMIGSIVGVVLVPIIWFVIQDREQSAETTGKTHQVTYRDIFTGYWEIVRNRQIWLSGLVACMLYLALSAFAEIWGIPFLRGAYHFKPEQAAFANSLIFLGWVIGGPLSGWISDKLNSRRWPLFIGSLGAALSMSVVLYAPHLSYRDYCGFLFLFGLFTSVELICFAVGHESAPKHVGATAMAFVNMLTMLGGFIFQPLIGKLLDFAWSGQMQNGIRHYSVQQYRVALTVIPIGMIISALLTLMIREHKKHADK